MSSTCLLFDRKMTLVKDTPPDDILDILVTSLRNGSKGKESRQTALSNATGSSFRTSERKQQERKQRAGSNATSLWSKTGESEQREKKRSPASRNPDSLLQMRVRKQEGGQKKATEATGSFPELNGSGQQRKSQGTARKPAAYSFGPRDLEQQQEKNQGSASNATSLWRRTSASKQQEDRQSISSEAGVPWRRIEAAHQQEKRRQDTTRKATDSSPRTTGPNQPANKQGASMKVTVSSPRTSTSSQDINEAKTSTISLTTQKSSEPEGLYTLSLKTDEAHQTALDAIRHVYYPGHDNQPPPHFPLFRDLPGSKLGQIEKDLDDFSLNQTVFDLNLVRPTTLRGTALLRVAKGHAERESKAIFDRLRSQWKRFLSESDDKAYKKHYSVLDVIDDEKQSALFVKEIKRLGIQGSRGTVVGFNLWRFEKGKLKYQKSWHFRPRPQRWKPPRRFS